MKIEKIYVDQESEQDPLTIRVLKRLSGIPVVRVSNRDYSYFIKTTRRISLTTGKRCLWLTRFRGNFVKPCPGTDRSYLCCNYWVINAQMNCPLDCSYCILQRYLNFPLITIYTNIERILEEIDLLQKSRPGRLLRIGTGELTDSLALDPFTEVSQFLIQNLASKPLLLELKTKTDFVGHLPTIQRRNAVVSWSVNPEETIKAEEHKSAPLRARLDAALCAISKGYRVGFHFDPLIDLPEWEKKYQAGVEALHRSIPEKEVVWVSLGSFRFPPGLDEVIRKRFPSSQVTTGELIRGLDGKMRYFRPIRTAVYRKIYSWMRERWKKVFIYLCMESDVIWKETMGFSPEDNHRLDYLFHESLYARFPDLELDKPERRYYAGN